MGAISIHNSPVFRRIFLAVLTSSLLPILVLAIITYTSVKGSLEHEVAQRLRHASKNAGMALLSHLNDLDYSLSQAAVKFRVDHPGLTRLPFDHSRLLQSSFLQVYACQSSQPPLQQDGLPKLSPAGSSRLAAGEPWLEYQHPGDHRLQLWLWTNGRDTDNRPIYLAGQIDLAQLKYFALSFVPPMAAMELTDFNLVPLQENQGASILNPLALKSRRHSAAGLISTEDSAQQAKLFNHWQLFLKASFGSPSWYILVGEKQSEAYASLYRFRNYGLLTCALTLWFILLASSILTRRTLGPLDTLQESVHLLSSGQFRNLPEIHSRDEFADLGRCFRQMAGTIAHQIDCQKQMAGTVRNILAALDEQKVVQALLQGLGQIVSADLGSLVLFPSNPADPALCWVNTPTDGHNILQSHTLSLSTHEYLRLELAQNLCCRIEPKEFPCLLHHLQVTGQNACFAFPVAVKDQLKACVLLVYEQGEPNAEDAIHTRQLADQLGVAVSNVSLVDELDDLNYGILVALARTVDANSQWTHGHSERVTLYALALADQLGISKAAKADLHRAGLLHDLGKVAIPSEILNKTGKLTQEEYAQMKKHPEYSARILEPIRVFDRVRPIVEQHHERFDGQGYPHGLRGEEIQLGARILAVADVYDALFSDRPYRDGWSQERVLEYIEQEAGKAFDPLVVEALSAAIPRVDAIPAEWAQQLNRDVLERSNFSSTNSDKQPIFLTSGETNSVQA